MDELFYIPMPAEQKYEEKRPPLSLEYLKQKRERDMLLQKIKKELCDKGYRVFKLTAKSFFNFLAIKSGTIMLVKVQNPLTGEHVSEKSLQRFSDKYGIDVFYVAKNGAKTLFQSKYRKYFTLKCYQCGTRSRIYLSESIKCKNCGRDYVFKCWYCGHEFDVKGADYCNYCNRFVCPKCGSCGCNEKELLLEWKKGKHLCSLTMVESKTEVKMIIKTKHGWLVMK